MPPRGPATPPRDVEGRIEGFDDWDNPIVAGEQLRVSLAESPTDGAKWCKAPKACYCQECFTPAPLGTYVRAKVNAKKFIVGWEIGSATAPAPPNQPGHVATAATAAAAPVDHEERRRDRRLAVLEAVARIFAADNAASLIRSADAVHRWVETGELPRPTAGPTAIRGGDQAASSAGVVAREAPLAERLAVDTTPAHNGPPAPTGDDEYTVDAVMHYIAKHDVDPARVFAALGINSQSAVVLENHITAWVLGDRQHRTAGGALQLIRNAVEVDR